MSGASSEKSGETPQRPSSRGPASWIRSHAVLATCLALSSGLLLSAVVAAVVVGDKSSQIDELEKQLADTEAQVAVGQDSVAEAERERDAAKRRAAVITGRAGEIVGDAKAQAKELVGDAKEQVGDLNGQIQEAQSDLASTQGKLDSVTASLQQAQEQRQMSTFTDGTWSVGQDILAGTYRSSAGGSCYWEILNSPSGGGLNNIVDNGFGPGATITVASGQWLRVDGCGTWNPGP